MDISKDTAREIIWIVLDNLWERRSFKWMLEKMFASGLNDGGDIDRGGPLWEEMMAEMENDVIEILAKD